MFYLKHQHLHAHSLFFLIAEGVVNGLVFTTARPFNWIGSRMDFNPGIDGPSEDVSRVLATMMDTLTIAILPNSSWIQIMVLKQRV
ncbi:hypothetical protein Hanom_Chr11g01022651 [Helianthus anomalus]